jgi:drug/metabolite transporter (DMT)-like permease
VEFVAWRFLIGAIILAILALPKGRLIWWHGAIAGVALFAGFALQTAGLQFTTALARSQGTVVAEPAPDPDLLKLLSS